MYPDLSLCLTLYGGADGGQTLTGKQLELEGETILIAGMPEQKIYQVLGGSKTPLVYPLELDENTIHHRLVIHVDKLRNISDFELKYLYSVD